MKKPGKTFKVKTIRKDGLENCFCTWLLDRNETKTAKTISSPFGLMCGIAAVTTRGAATLCEIHADKYDELGKIMTGKKI